MRVNIVRWIKKLLIVAIVVCLNTFIADLYVVDPPSFYKSDNHTLTSEIYQPIIRLAFLTSNSASYILYIFFLIVCIANIILFKNARVVEKIIIFPVTTIALYYSLQTSIYRLYSGEFLDVEAPARMSTSHFILSLSFVFLCLIFALISERAHSKIHELRESKLSDHSKLES